MLLKIIERNNAISRIILIALWFQNWHVQTLANLVCNTADCRKLSEAFKNNMNPAGNPCTDFYDYVCKRWGTHNPRPEFVASWDSDNVLLEKAYEGVKSLLEDKTVSKIPQIEHAKELYRACTNLPSIVEVDIDTVKKKMAKVGSWPMFFNINKKLSAEFSWVTIDSEYVKMTGESAFFDFNVVTDSDQDKKVITKLLKPYSPYGMLKRSNDWESEFDQRRHYKSFLKKVIKAVSNIDVGPYKRAIDSGLDSVINFREEIRTILYKMDKDKSEKMTIKKLQSWYKSLATPAESQIDWLKEINALYKNGKDAAGTKISETTIVKVGSTNYVAKLIELLGKTPKHTIANHIHLYFAERQVKIDSDMKADLLASVNSDKANSNRIRYKVPCWKWCIKNHYMKDTLGRMYAKSFFSSTDKVRVEKFVEIAKELLIEQIISSNWVDAKMKRDSKTKIQNIKKVIGYSDWADKSATSFDQKKMNPMDVAVFFIPEINKLFFSAACLQWPVYRLGLPYVIEYGSTFPIIGHELYHAFDSYGITFDKNGNNPWWSKVMRTQFEKQSKCFEEQYTKYRENEMKKINFTPASELPSTLDEDIADVMGLKLAYKGFKNYKHKQKGVCQTLPGFEKFDCDQLFFMAFANTYCGDPSIEGKKQSFLDDIHSSSQIRVNGAVANMKEFSTAFNCAPGDPLYAEKTCDIWKK